MTKKGVHTTIDEKLWKLAVFKDIKWHEALTTGIKVMAGDIMSEEHKISKRLEELRNEMELMEHQLTKVRKEKKLKKDIDKEKVVMSW